jgi:hypothetical protein
MMWQFVNCGQVRSTVFESFRRNARSLCDGVKFTLMPRAIAREVTSSRVSTR